MTEKEQNLKKFKAWTRENKISEEFGMFTKVNHISHESIIILDNNTLLRYLHIYDGDLEAAKNLLIVNLKMRRDYPKLFKHRNMMSPDLQKATRTT
jgi:hypothetical protein